MKNSEKPKDPLWVRICGWYMLALMLFAVTVPFLPKLVQKATHPSTRPIGMMMMLVFVFCMPIVLPPTPGDRLFCIQCGEESASENECSLCDGVVVKIPAPAKSLRSRAIFGMVLVLLMIGVFLYAAKGQQQ